MWCECECERGDGLGREKVCFENREEKECEAEWYMCGYVGGGGGGGRGGGEWELCRQLHVHRP